MNIIKVFKLPKISGSALYLGLFLLISSGLFIFASIPFLSRTATSKQNPIRTFVHEYDVDYFTYLYFIREGKDGGWTTPALYTTEPSVPTYMYLYYTILGKAAKFSRVSPVAAYHLARTGTYVIITFLLFLIARRFFRPGTAFLASVLALFSGPPVNVFGMRFFGNTYDNLPLAWLYQQPFFRSEFLAPHHTAGIALMLTGILSVFSDNPKHRQLNLILLYVCAFLGTVFYPFTGLFFVFILPGAGLAVIVRHYHFYRKIRPADVFGLVLPAVPAVLGMLLIKSNIESGFPWSVSTSYDIGFFAGFPDFERDFILAQSIWIVLAIPAVFRILTGIRDRNKLILVVWAFLPLVLLFFTREIGAAKFRIAYLFNFIPLGLLDMLTLRWVISKLPNPVLKKTFASITAGLFILLSVPVLNDYFNASVHTYSFVSDDAEFLNNLSGAIGYLNASADPYSRILSTDGDGLILPAFSRSVSYLAHKVYTSDFETKKDLTLMFFTGLMENDQARVFVKDNRINYILVRKTSSGEFDINIYKIPLAERYKNDKVTLYQVL
jgi:hypothetical protein